MGKLARHHELGWLHELLLGELALHHELGGLHELLRGKLRGLHELLLHELGGIHERRLHERLQLIRLEWHRHFRHREARIRKLRVIRSCSVRACRSRQSKHRLRVEVGHRRERSKHVCPGHAERVAVILVEEDVGIREIQRSQRTSGPDLAQVRIAVDLGVVDHRVLVFRERVDEHHHVVDRDLVDLKTKTVLGRENRKKLP